MGSGACGFRLRYGLYCGAFSVSSRASCFFFGQAFGLHGFEFGEVLGVIPAQTGFLDAQVVQLARVGHVDVLIDQEGVNVAVGFVRIKVGEGGSAERVDALLENGDAIEAPIGIGQALDQFALAVTNGCEVLFEVS